MREYGSSLTAIGLLKLLALPWLFKFLWAPLLDRYYVRAVGPHRSWIFLMQSGAIGALLVMSLLSPEWLFTDGIYFLFALLVLINLFSSTQDVATDGLAVSRLKENLRGLGNSIQVCGYKLGLMLGGSGLLILIYNYSWGVTLQGVAVMLALMLIPTFIFKESDSSFTSDKTPKDTNKTVIGGYNFWSFFGVKHIVFWLAVLLTYKLADGMSSSLVKPMLKDFGMNLEEIGQVTFVSSLVGLIGAVLVGWLYRYIKPIKLMVTFAVLQLFSISSYSLIPEWHAMQSENFTLWVYTIVTLDQLVDSMSTVVLFAFMMGHCRKSHEGGDYTLQACIQVFAAGLAGAFSGWLGDLLGNYQWSFLVAGACALLALVALNFYWSSPLSR